MKPYVGQIVHLVQRGSPEHCPALVCYVRPDGKLNICPFQPTGNVMGAMQGVPQDEEGKATNTWHFIEDLENSAEEPMCSMSTELSESSAGAEDSEDPEPDGEGSEEDSEEQ